VSLSCCHLCASLIQHVAGVSVTGPTRLHDLQASRLSQVNANYKLETLSGLQNHLLLNTTTGVYRNEQDEWKSLFSLQCCTSKKHQTLCQWHLSYHRGNCRLQPITGFPDVTSVVDSSHSAVATSRDRFHSVAVLIISMILATGHNDISCTDCRYQCASFLIYKTSQNCFSYFFENCYNFPSVLVIMNLDYENINMIDFVCDFEIQKLSRSVLLLYFPLKMKGQFMRLEDSIVIRM
jgi:hypothetical protein